LLLGFARSLAPAALPWLPEMIPGVFLQGVAESPSCRGENFEFEWTRIFHHEVNFNWVPSGFLYYFILKHDLGQFYK